MFLADDQLEAGPDVVDGADLDVDQAEGERMAADVVLADLAAHAGSTFRPRHPDHPVRGDLPHRRRQRVRQLALGAREQVPQIDVRAKAGRDRHTVRGVDTDQFPVRQRLVLRADPETGLDAELLR